MQLEACPACEHFDSRTLDRLLVLESFGWVGGRGPRTLARPFGLSRDAIRRHRGECLTGERRAAVERWLLEKAGVDPDGEEGGGGLT